MRLSKEMKKAVKDIFERPDYYGRSLNDSDVQEIADSLVSFGELLIKVIKNKNS